MKLAIIAIFLMPIIAGCATKLATDDDLSRLEGTISSDIQANQAQIQKLQSQVTQIITQNDPKPWLEYNKFKYLLLAPLGIAILYLIWRIYTKEKQNGIVH